MKIGVIGAGRLGICLALLLEKSGYNLLVSDIRVDYVNSLNNRSIETNEPLVQELLSKSKNLRATTNNLEVIKECDLIFTLVATPSLEDGSYDISSVKDVMYDFCNANFSVKGKSFIVGCTTNPGDCEYLKSKLNPIGVEVYYNPEFIAQGSIIKDLQNADMVLVGGPDGVHAKIIEEMYKKIQLTEPKIYFMSTTSAELVKLAVNCFLTTKISYANMVGEVMALAGLDSEINLVLDAIGSDTRIGNKYLKYGYGFGGPCLPRDNRSFSAYARKLGLEFNLGKTTDDFNNQHAKFLKEYFIKKNIKKLPFAFRYVSYKNGTDILTESQQYRLCIDLLDEGYKVYVLDNEPILSQIKNYLETKYEEKVVINEIPNEEVFWIEL